MKEHRNGVVITGMGVISPIGIGLGPFWEAVQAGVSGTKRVDGIINLAGIPTKIGAPAEDFRPDALREMGKNPRKLDRAAQMTLVAAHEALSDARLDLAAEDMDRFGVIMGTGIGGFQTFVESHEQFLRQGPDRVS
ncbi:TPA: beta-ketoacyl-[acyl-carrier-protein] synthase II, partial [Candidatus Acetothermia bacterium]|nr:beta-ketoacyl-[acyl-carrier-protein] synthase II [Candidatus Acetothermia bacterium]